MALDGFLFETYKPGEMILMANGITLSAWSEITIEPMDEELLKLHVGPDGTVAMTESANKVYLATIKFKQYSNSAKALFAFSRLSGNSRIFNFTVQDPAVADEFLNSTHSVITNRQKAKRGAEAHEETEVKIALVKPTVGNFL